MNTTGISRRSFMKAAAIGAAWLSGGVARAMAAGAAGAAQAGGATMPGPTGAGGGKRPNIVVILADDLGYECIGADGGTSYKTPVLDKLAAGGARFDHGYAQPLCTPTRVQLMTGIYNVRNYVRFGLLDPKQTTFAHLLKQAGYATCVVGKWQLEGGFEGPGHFGFDEYCLWQLNRRPGRYANPGLEVNGKQIN
jgi:arylsulfatase A